MILSGLIIISVVRPDFSEELAGFLYPKQNQDMAARTDTPNWEDMIDLPENSKDENTEWGSSEPAGWGQEGSGDSEGNDAPEGSKDSEGSEYSEGSDVPEGSEDSEGSEYSESSMNQEVTTETVGTDETGEDITSDYVQPGQSEIVIPVEVSGRNGYQQIKDEGQQVDENAAVRLQNQLDIGYTGDGLEFDAAYYPYYAILDEKEKHIYRQIYANANNLYSVFAPVETVTVKQIKNIFSAVYNDHPQLFWLEASYAAKYIWNGQCIEIDLMFNRTARDLEQAKADFEQNANQILAEAQNLGSNYEKEKYVHDILLDRITYNLSAEMNQSAYSALVNGQTVCAGYARAFQYLLQQLGIPCYYCTGYAGEDHGWNIVALDDGYYNVDATWDDTDSGNYNYFNKSDEDFANTHIRQELSVYLPPCNGQAYRNLEQEAEENKRRSLEDVGITEEQVILDLPGYYEDCYHQLVQNGTGSYTFCNVIEGEDLLNEWYQDYQYNIYRKAYMEDAMAALGASSSEMRIETEELQKDRYLIIHKVSVW